MIKFRASWMNSNGGHGPTSSDPTLRVKQPRAASLASARRAVVALASTVVLAALVVTALPVSAALGYPNPTGGYYDTGRGGSGTIQVVVNPAGTPIPVQITVTVVKDNGGPQKVGECLYIYSYPQRQWYDIGCQSADTDLLSNLGSLGLFNVRYTSFPSGWYWIRAEYFWLYTNGATPVNSTDGAGLGPRTQWVRSGPARPTPDRPGVDLGTWICASGCS